MKMTFSSIFRRGLVVFRIFGFANQVLSLFGLTVSTVVLVGWAWLSELPWVAILVIGLVWITCLILIVVSLFGKFGRIQPMRSPSLLQRLRQRNILWNFEGFLGSNWRQDEAVYVACFQIKGINVSRRSIQLDSARIVSCITERSISVLLRTTSGYVSPTDTNPIPSKANFHMKALFYDPNKKENGEREGLSEWEFIDKFGEFIFEAKYGGKTFIKTFNIFNIQAEIDRVKPSYEPTPRVTARRDDHS